MDSREQSREAPDTDASVSAEQGQPGTQAEGGNGASADEKGDDSIEKQLENALNEIEEMKDGFIRAKAEVENVRRRSQNEIVAARKYAIEGFAQELLSVVDSLDQASKVDLSASSDEAVEKMREGLELTLKQFEKVMEKFGITVVEAGPGTKFDPELHQAISVIPTNEIAAEHIVTVMQKGYALKDRLLRPAMVTIAKSAENS